MTQGYIGLARARRLVGQRVAPLAPRAAPLERLAGLVAAREARARVRAPSVTASTKDGFAVRGADLAGATAERPVVLAVVGAVAAGEPASAPVGPGQAVRINTGAPLPPGADAVLAGEFARASGAEVACLAPAEPGRNVMPAGSDLSPGDVLVRPGQRLTPAAVGLLAAGGHSGLEAHPLPRVALLATGREVIAPGQPLPSGAVYASNLTALAAWLRLEGMPPAAEVVDDDLGQIREAAGRLLSGHDALLTSGGAWTSGRDLVVAALEGLGWEQVFRRVRMGPGKGVALGLVGGKPVFCLPGGPPSNEMAFLQLGLPGLLALAGRAGPALPLLPARLAEPLAGRADWTQFWHGVLEPSGRPGEPPGFRPLPFSGRLRAMAGSQAIACLPEGRAGLAAGSGVDVQILPG
jgi:molybdopterin molybdotransferase